MKTLVGKSPKDHPRSPFPKLPKPRKVPRPDEIDHSLSEREIDVLRLLGMRYSVKETATLLKISPKTVETHKRVTAAKLAAYLGGKSLVHLSLYAQAVLLIENPYKCDRALRSPERVNTCSPTSLRLWTPAFLLPRLSLRATLLDDHFENTRNFSSTTFCTASRGAARYLYPATSFGLATREASSAVRYATRNSVLTCTTATPA